MKRINVIITVAALGGIMVACGNSNQWKLEGELDGAAGKNVIVEYQSFVGWQGVDTVTADDKGRFSVSRQAKGYPEIFRLRVDDQILYFPIDSVETITLSGNMADLEKSWELSGTTDADMLMRAEKRIAKAIGENKAGGYQADSLLKRDLTAILLEDPKSVTAYYIISRSIAGKPIFSVSDPRDLRVIGAVANAFKEFRPNDPRTSRLTEIFLQGRAAAGLTKGKSIEVEAIGIQDIELYDVKGRRQSLSDIASSNKVVVLNFTAYGADESPLFNRALNTVYNQYHSQGMEIYQVAVDEDELSWRNAAENLPWIAVRNAGTNSLQNLLKYNVTGLPVTYVIADGEVAERVTDVDKLSAAVAQYLR